MISVRLRKCWIHGRRDRWRVSTRTNSVCFTHKNEDDTVYKMETFSRVIWSGMVLSNKSVSFFSDLFKVVNSNALKGSYVNLKVNRLMQTHVLVLYNAVLCCSPSCCRMFLPWILFSVRMTKRKNPRLTTRPAWSWQETDGTSRQDRCKKLLETQMCLRRVQQRIVTPNVDTVTFGDIYCCSLSNEIPHVTSCCKKKMLHQSEGKWLTLTWGRYRRGLGT